jgi:hypothetical protein
MVASPQLQNLDEGQMIKTDVPRFSNMFVFVNKYDDQHEQK